MESPHAWVTIAMGQYLLLVWSATVVGALVLVVLAGLWTRYFPRRVDDAAAVDGNHSERELAASSSGQAASSEVLARHDFRPVTAGERIVAPWAPT